MAILFISDLHLSEQEPHITQLFLHFLQHRAPTAEALYILGDLFEAWAGDDDLSPYNKSIIAALKQLSDSNVRVYLMHGNRDFLIGKQFARLTGCQLLSDPCVIDLYGEATLLVHGDSLCTLDTNHIKFRQLTRHAVIKWLFLALPLFIRLWIIKKLRHASKAQGKKLTADMMDIAPAALTQIMTEHSVQQLIHGHTHKPTLHWFTLHNKLANRIVLSDWNQQGNVLICQPNSKQLTNFRSP